MATEIEVSTEPDASPKSRHNNRYKHIFERDDGEEKTVFANTNLSVEEAAEQIDIDPDEWTWGYTKDTVRGGAAIPCADCRRAVWGSVRTAKLNRGEGTARCRYCVRDDE